MSGAARGSAGGGWLVTASVAGKEGVSSWAFKRTLLAYAAAPLRESAIESDMTKSKANPRGLEIQTTRIFWQ